MYSYGPIRAPEEELRWRGEEMSYSLITPFRGTDCAIQQIQTTKLSTSNKLGMILSVGFRAYS